MNTARNHKDPQSGDAQKRAGDGSDDLQLPNDLRNIDWHALRSRLFAAQNKLGLQGVDDASSQFVMRGSFDDAAASVLNAYQASLTGVNRDSSSNRKPHDGNDPDVADVNGERG